MEKAFSKKRYREISMRSLNKRHAIGLLVMSFFMLLLITSGDGDVPTKVADPTIRHDPPPGDFPR
jgi:hypothetical protein